MAAESPELEPFVGPRPFRRTEEDRIRFFGRDRETEEIVSLILSHSVVLVYAQSGAGKTSLFEAQVAPALGTSGFTVFPLARVRAAIPEGIEPAAVENIYAFAALLSIAQPEGGRGEADASPAGASLAGATLQMYLQANGSEPPSPRCIVFDQFEEIFTDESVFALRPTRWQEEQVEFFRQVEQAVRSDPLLRAVFVIRKEHLAELDRFAGLLPEGFQTRFHLEPLGREAAIAAVKLPVRNTRRSFADGVPEELVDKLLLMRVDVGAGEIREVRGRLVEPLHLQLVCQSLWDELDADDTVITKEHLRTLGDVDQVLGQLYDGAVRAASAAGGISEKRLRRRIESDFITPAGTRGIVFVGDEADGAGFRKAVDELERQHLVRAEWRAGADWHELTHDRLIQPIRASNARYRAVAARRVRRLVAIAVAVAAIAGGIAAGVVFAETRDGGSAGAREEGFVLVQYSSLRATGSTAPITRATFDPDGKLVATASDEGTVRLWDWRTGRVVAELQGSQPLTSVAFSPDGSRVVTAGADGAARVWEWQTATLAAVLQSGRPAPLSSAAFSPDGSRVATASADGTVRVWSWRTKTVDIVLPHPSQVTSAAFSPADPRLLVTASSDGGARVWNWRSGQDVVGLAAGREPAPLSSAAFGPDGEQIVTAGVDGVARVWSWQEQRIDAELKHPAQVASAVLSSPPTEFVVTAAADGVARVWDWRARKVAQELSASQEPAPLSNAAVTPVGSFVVTAGADGIARIYGPASASGSGAQEEES
jgi:WD40 repeat protein